MAHHYTQANWYKSVAAVSGVVGWGKLGRMETPERRHLL